VEGDVVPALQLVQIAAPDVDWYIPAAQKTQVLTPALAYIPEAQTVQAVAPVFT
jgi:hypothetical protein